MNPNKYAVSKKVTLAKDGRWVYKHSNQNLGITFRCPCGEFMVNLQSPPHKIEFDSEGVLSVDNSIGSKKTNNKPENWCHFYIEDGVPKMASDAQCPGANKTP